MSAKEFFDYLLLNINTYLPMLINILSIPTGFMIAFWLSRRIVDSIVAAFNPDETEAKKKSYEEEMAVYDNETVQPLILPTSLSLEDLLSEDGEIPDRFIQG